jgi:hypothetical protein
MSDAGLPSFKDCTDLAELLVPTTKVIAAGPP